VLCISVGLAAQEKEKKERKKAHELLPDSTVLFIKIEDAVALKERFQESAFGQMLKDEKMKPFVEAMYGEAKNAYENVKDGVAGVELGEIFNLPQGEICFALVAQERADPAPVFIIDVDPESETAKKLVDRGRELAEGDGAAIETEEGIEGLELQIIKGGGGESDENVVYFEHEGTYVFSNDKDVITTIWERWNDMYEGEQPPLTKNRKFITIMNRCAGTKDSPPELSFYVDPIEMYKSFTRGNAGARLALAFLPTLGLDGLLAVGGSVIYNEQGYDSVMHAHLLLSSPRNGIFKMIALKPGINDPEPWVPRNIISYVTFHLNAKQLLGELTTIVDAFGDDGSFDAMIENNINEQLGIDFKEDFIASLEGRATWITWAEPPARINSQANALAIKLKDVKKFETVMTAVLDRVLEGNEEAIVENRYKGQTFWSEPEGRVEERQQRMREFRGGRRGGDDEEQDEQGDNVGVDIRLGSPCFMILDDYFIVTESRKFMQTIIETNKGDNKTLADDEEYKNIIKQMERQLGTQVPSITMFNRPAEQMKSLFDAAKSENTKSLLERGAEENEYVRGLRNAYEDNPLPDFEDVKRYFPPAGGFVVSDQTGFHFLFFGMKPKPAESGK
jgi:hypothetical protein